MSHQDQGRSPSQETHLQALDRTIGWWMDDCDFSRVTCRSDCSWSPGSLAAAALFWTLGDETNLTDRFFSARKITARLFPRQEPAGSYQAFVKLLRKWTGPLLMALLICFREQMHRGEAGEFLTGGFAVFAVDGSRVALPRTVSNQQAYCVRNSRQKAPARSRRGQRGGRQGRRKKKRTRRKNPRRSRRGRSVPKKLDSPNAWVTTMWHVGTGLPWDWRTGPSNSSERDHFRQMIDDLPPAALVTADAGFVGYEYWKTLLDGGRHFVIRVGASVTLLKQLGYAREHAHTVSLWPDKAAARQQPPLTLRLVVIHNGKHPVYLVTDLPPSRLSDQQVCDIYKARWGVEVFYRSFKQTFDRQKLRCHAASNVPVELNWSLAGLWAACLFGKHHLAASGGEPSRLSVAGVLKALRKPLREYKSRPDDGEDLASLLDLAVMDHYVRTDKTSRGYPQKRKKEPPAGKPRLKNATRSQKTAATRIKQLNQQTAKPTTGLTA